MSTSQDYKIDIIIAGEIEKSFYGATKATKTALKDMRNYAIGFSKGLNEAEPFFSDFEKMAKKSFDVVAAAALAAGGAITGGLYASISAGSEFEAAFAGVKKTVNASDEEIKQMRDDIREMAKEMPSTAAELSEIAESAGQLGVHTENITEFARTMADMEVATNLTSDEAATEFAQFANITGMAQDKFDELGSSVVALGNNLATTEADMVSMGMRIAAAGEQIGLSEAQIMGYAASLSSVGIEAEAGGSAFSKLLVNMQLAAETGKGLKDYAKVARMTGEEFKNAFKQDASGAINAFLSGLNDTERNGKSAIAVLTDMGITEVRLRDTLLRASSANDMFGNALDISSQAWKENSALSNEAMQYYQTFENQCGILGNKITDIGISIYDDLKPGLTDVIALANGFVDGVAGNENVVGDIIDSAVENMPRMVREAKAMGEAIEDFAEPFLKVGGWLVDNPGLIVGTIAGIGGSLATYKVASGITALASSLSALNPAGMAIMAIGGAAAVIAGIGTEVKKSAAEAKRANLNRHFGNIALSMKELQEAASFIVSGNSLGQVWESLAAISELDGLSDSISDTARELDKANWKVSIGMELTEQEKQDYQDQVESYIEETREYLEQRQYAISLSASAILGDGANGSEAIAMLNEFYTGKMQELSEAETELKSAISEAFADGILDSEEIDLIATLQEDVAKIKDSVTGADVDAALDLVGVKYGGRKLDADSTMNLMAEVHNVASEAMSGYDQSYSEAMSDYRLMHTAGDISQEEFDNVKNDLDMGWLGQKSEVLEKSTSMTTGLIQQSYGDELGEFMNPLQEETRRQLKEMLDAIAYEDASNWLPFLGENILNAIDVDKTTRDAAMDLFEQLKPDMEQLQELRQQYMAVGAEIPYWMSERLSDMGAIGALAGDTDAIWEVIGATAESEEYQDAIRKISESGGYLPEQIAYAIGENQYMIDDAITQSWQDAKNAYGTTYGMGLGIMIAASHGDSDPEGATVSSTVTAGHADGGIFNVPHIAWFAEDGPEAVIPLDNSQNAIELWKKTGELLGMDGLTGGIHPVADNIERIGSQGSAGQEISLVYNPTLQFYGNAPSEETINNALETDYERFVLFMEKYNKDNYRFSFR